MYKLSVLLTAISIATFLLYYKAITAVNFWLSHNTATMQSKTFFTGLFWLKFLMIKSNQLFT
jgi:hypothetical protein